MNKQVPKLKGVKFSNKSYDEVTLPLSDGTVIYCDIPYKATTKYKIGSGFDYDRFYKWCIETAKKGYKVFISEYDMPSDLFDCIWSKEVTNAIAVSKTSKPTEKLFVPKLVI